MSPVGPTLGIAALLTAGLVGAAGIVEAAGLDEVRAPQPLPHGGAGDSGGVLVETFDPYSPGWLPPQGGWTSSYDPIFTVVSPGIRSRSARHLSDGFGEFVSDTLVSPPFGPSRGPIAVTLSRSAGAGRHQIVPVDLATELVLTRIELAAGGAIRVAQLVGGSLVFQPTGRSWTADVPVRIGVATDEAGVLEVFVDGQSAFVGVDVVQAATGSPGRMDLLAFVANNPDEGTRLLIDDIGPDPAAPPAAAPVVDIPSLGPGGLVLLALLLSFASWATLRSRGRGRS